MDRMSPQDASFLHVENDVNHMHIASVGIFEGPAPENDDDPKGDQKDDALKAKENVEAEEEDEERQRILLYISRL